jgi:hypothetical protein
MSCHIRMSHIKAECHIFMSHIEVVCHIQKSIYYGIMILNQFVYTTLRPFHPTVYHAKKQMHRTSVQTTSFRLLRAKRSFNEYFHRRKQHIRMIQSSANANNSHTYYKIYDTAIFGKPDVNAAVGNPLKGLAGGP